MADSLKQFSNLQNKTFTELKTGVTLVSTSASEKAVIKGISIENPNSRAVSIKLDSNTGTTVADASKSKSLSGNEILDNSQSLVAVTTSELVLTEIRAAGWGEGMYNNTNSSDYFPASRSNSDGFHIYNHGQTGPIFSPDQFTQPIDYSNHSTRNFPASSDDNVSGKCWGESFEDKFGNVWVIATADSNDFEINGSNKSENVLYKIINDASNTAATNLKTFAAYSGICYDGERYIYGVTNGANHFKKYDTWTVTTSDVFTQVPLYNCDVSDTTAFSDCYFHPGKTVLYYRDGYIIWKGTSNNHSQGQGFSITEVATGKTKLLFDTKFTNAFNSRHNESTGEPRRSIGITKATNGDYFAWIANWSQSSQSTSGNNFWCITNMGTDPKTTYIPNGQSAKKTYEHNMWTATSGLHTNYYELAYRLGTTHGSYFNAPRGYTIWSPTIDRYNFLQSRRYQAGAPSNMHSQQQSFALDFDEVENNTPGGFFKHFNGEQVGVGSIHITADASVASSAFGTLSFRTTGVLVN
jgi:hypothetical protein